MADDALRAPSGLLLVDKPSGITSHGVVARVRRMAHTRKVGHGGTLDPMATGLLVLGVNTGTKLLQYVTGAAKTYVATMRFGVSTTTDDAEGEVLTVSGTRNLPSDRLDSAMEVYRGQILQVPTTVSAIKVDGKRAYALAREGREVELKARPVSVYRLEMQGPPRMLVAGDGGANVVDVDVLVECSSGTYIRALARDIGADLGVGGHLTALRRVTTGPWGIDDCMSLEGLEQLSDAGEALPIIPLHEAAARLLPTLVIDSDAAARFHHGQAPSDGDIVERLAPTGRRASALGEEGIWGIVGEGQPSRLLGIVKAAGPSNLEFKVVNVFPASFGDVDDK